MRPGDPSADRRLAQRIAFRRRIARGFPTGSEEGIPLAVSGATHEAVDPEFDAVDLADLLRGLVIAGEIPGTDDPC